jgi:hypothetical protein
MNSGLDIQVTIGPGSTSALLIDSQTGARAGTIDDLAKIGAARSFVNRERRSLLGSSTASEYSGVVSTLLDTIREADQSWQQPARLDKDFLQILKQFKVKLDLVQDNANKVFALNTESTQSETRSYLLAMASRIQEAYITVLKEILQKGKIETGALPKMLLSLGVPKFMHSKLSTSKLDVKQGSDLNRILFPFKAMNGFALTVEEVRTPMVLGMLGPVARYSNWLFALVQDDRFLHRLASIDDAIALTDQSVPKVSQLLAAPVLLVPHCSGPEYNFEAPSKNKDCGFAISARFDTPGAALRSFSEAVLRLMTGMIITQDTITEFWLSVFPALKIERSKISKSNNIHKVALDTMNDEYRSRYTERFLALDNKEAKKLHLKWITLQLRVSKDTPFMVEYQRILGIDPKMDTEPPYVKVSNTAVPKVWSQKRKPELDWAKLTAPPETESARGRRKDLEDNFFPTREKSDKRSEGLQLTKLGDTSAALLKAIGQIPYSKEIKPSVKAWLVGFSNERIQKAAATYMFAQFDDIFRSEVSYESDSDDESSETGQPDGD